jgi:hypothetical protein
MREAEANIMKSHASLDSIEETMQIKKDGSLSPIDGEIDEDKMIRDFISERDMFIQRHKQRKRIIFN